MTGLTSPRVSFMIDVVALTHVAMVHDASHKEPWMIAMSETPSSARAFDYGLRRGSRACCVDLKSRGLDLEKPAAPGGLHKAPDPYSPSLQGVAPPLDLHQQRDPARTSLERLEN